MLQLGLLASHNGSNTQAIINACKRGTLAAQVRLVISNNSAAGVLARAHRQGIAALHLSRRTHPDGNLDQAILAALKTHGVEWICLAGYMKRLGPLVLEHYAGHILNIHPSLLSKYGGQDMYGHAVHQAVLAAGDTYTGATIHLVNSEYDQGAVLLQTQVPVDPHDTPETLAARVLVQEHRLYVETLRQIAAGTIDLASYKEWGRTASKGQAV